MTMGIRGFKTKKELKAFIGQDVRSRIVEASIFGKEFKETGANTVVGPDAYNDRRWFAIVHTVDGIVQKVE